MHSLLRNNVTLPIKLEKLANNAGVWEREVYPDFWLMDYPGGPVKISGLGFDMVQNCHLGDAVEKHLARELNVSKVQLNLELKKSLDLFSYEYEMVRHNGMDCLIRVAKKDKIDFAFYNHIPEDKQDEYIACFVAKKNRISFRVPAYQEQRGENVLAHELGHNFFLNDFAYSENQLGTITCSDLGLKWMSLNQMRASLLNRQKWATACKHYFETYRREYKGLQPFHYFIGNTIRVVQTCKSYYRKNPADQRRVQQEEMMCRLIGFAGKHKNGIKCFRCQTIDRSLLEVLMQMGAAYANGNMSLYDVNRKTIQSHQLSSKITKEMMLFWKVYNETQSVCDLNDLRRVNYCLNRFQKSLETEAGLLERTVQYHSENHWLHLIEQKKIKRLVRALDKNQLKIAQINCFEKSRE